MSNTANLSDIASFVAPTLEELLKSTPKLSKTDLEYLQEWMSKQPHFPTLSDLELVPMLNRWDFSVERTKKFLDVYFTMRTHAPELFKYRDPRTAPIIDQYKYFHATIGGPDAKGNYVVCTGINPVDIGDLDIEISGFIAFAFLDLAAKMLPTAPGFILVMDASNLSTGHITKLSVSLLKKTLAYIQDGVPLKLNAVHVIRLNPVVDKLMMIVKPMLSKETQERLHFHTKNLDAFYEVVSKDTLPKEYGGTLRPVDEQHKELISKLQSEADWLKTLERRVTDESQRPGRAKGEGDVFGVDGTFKKLDFD